MSVKTFLSYEQKTLENRNIPTTKLCDIYVKTNKSKNLKHDTNAIKHIEIRTCESINKKSEI